MVLMQANPLREQMGVGPWKSRMFWALWNHWNGILFQNTEERKVGVYVRAHPTIELLEDRLYLGKISPLVTRVETKVFHLAFSQKSDFHQSKFCRRENCNFAKFRTNWLNFAFFRGIGKGSFLSTLGNRYFYLNRTTLSFGSKEAITSINIWTIGLKGAESFVYIQ